MVALGAGALRTIEQITQSSAPLLHCDGLSVHRHSVSIGFRSSTSVLHWRPREPCSFRTSLYFSLRFWILLTNGLTTKIRYQSNVSPLQQAPSYNSKTRSTHDQLHEETTRSSHLCHSFVGAANKLLILRYASDSKI